MYNFDKADQRLRLPHDIDHQEGVFYGVLFMMHFFVIPVRVCFG